MFVHMYVLIYLFICLSFYLSVSLSPSLSIYLAIYLCFSLLIYLSTLFCLSIYLSSRFLSQCSYIVPCPYFILSLHLFCCFTCFYSLWIGCYLRLFWFPSKILCTHLIPETQLTDAENYKSVRKCASSFFRDTTLLFASRIVFILSG